MNPTGDYDTFHDEFLSRYNAYGDEEVISFGILLADFRQHSAQEYILNYLEDFHLHSGTYFDFFIPGYVKKWAATWYQSRNRISKYDCIQVGGTGYSFSYELFSDFCSNLHKQFGIRYTYNPMLILMSMKRCFPETAQYIIIELDSIPGGIQRSGEFFDRIFEIAQADNSLEEFRRKCFHTFVRDNLITTITKATGLSWLEQIRRIGSEYRRYRIRSTQ